MVYTCSETWYTLFVQSAYKTEEVGMPWKASTAMSQRQEFVELALQDGANIRALCRQFGITPRTGYKWLHRYRVDGPAGLFERSRRPQHSPRQSSAVVEAQILQVRYAHRAWGGRKIRWTLQANGLPSPPSASTITAILARHGELEAGESSKHRALQRFEMLSPNELWQMDFKGPLEMANGQACHPLTVLDDRSRFLVGLRACKRQQGRTVRAQLCELFEGYGMPERMLMDNGSVWKGYHSKLSYWLIRLGIQITHGRIRHPQTQGKDERLHRTLQSELLDQRTILDLEDGQRQFDEWREIYNTQRPHEALGMQPPCRLYVPSLRPFPRKLPPIEYEPDAIVRMTDCAGRVQYQGRRFRIGKAFHDSLVALRPGSLDGAWDVYFCKQRIAQINLRLPQP
jgi:transposase InsO family protein